MKKALLVTDDVQACLDLGEQIQRTCESNGQDFDKFERDWNGRATLGWICAPTGCGKTRVGKFIAKKYGAYYLQVQSAWTERDLFTNWLGVILGWDPNYQSIRDLRRQLIQELRGEGIGHANSQPRGLFTVVDESDYLVVGARHPLLDITRDIADATAHGVVYLSVTNQIFARRLAAPGPFTAQVSSRIIDRVEFGKPTLAKAGLFAKELIEGVTFEVDLVRWCWTASRQWLEGGSLAGLLRIFQRIEADAIAAGVTGSLSVARCAELGLGGVSSSEDTNGVEHEAEAPTDVLRPRRRVA